MGWAASKTTVAPDTYEFRCGVENVCYDAARDECPHGFTELSNRRWSTGTTVNSQTYGPPEARTTNVQVYDRTAGLLTVRCNPPQFCETQEECRPMGLRCAIAEDYPGRFACAK